MASDCADGRHCRTESGMSGEEEHDLKDDKECLLWEKLFKLDEANPQFVKIPSWK